MIWQIKTLDELGFVARGKSKHRPRGDKKLYGGKYPLIQTGDIQKTDFYISEYSNTYNDVGLAQSKLWKKGTLCLSIVGANTAESAILGFDACFPDSVIGFIANPEMSNEIFIKYYFDTMKLQMRKISDGGARENLSMEKLFTFKIPTPPVIIQNKIASILSSYDELIENNKQRIKLLEEMTEEIYKEWFVRLRFPDYETTKIVDDLPEGWEKVNAESIFDIKIGKTPPREEKEWFTENNEGIKWVSIRDINNSSVFIFNTSEEIIYDGISKFNLNIAKKNTVILSFKLTVGKISIVTENMVSNEAIAHFNIIDESSMNREYIYCYLKNFRYSELGNTSSIGNAINSKIVKNMPIIKPKKNIINGFSQLVFPLFSEIELLNKKKQLLQETRDLLLPRLISGKLSVEHLLEEGLMMAAEPKEKYKETNRT